MGTPEDVRERLSIETVVGEVVALKRAGNTYKGLCPFHREKTPSFTVSPARGSYKCFGCGAAGDIFTFVMATKNMDFGDALRELAHRAGVELDDPRQGRIHADQAARLYEMNAAAATYFQSLLLAPVGAGAREYLQKRAITTTTVERFSLGYASEARDALLQRLRQSGYKDEEILKAGLAIAPDEEGAPLRDRWRGRLIFPIRDVKGHIVGFGGRTMGDGQPKYLNTPATEIFEKSRVLYGIEQADSSIRSSRESVVVEGYVDALRAHQEGFPNVVASLGTAITEHQLRALARLAPRLVLALDADPAGQKAAVRAGLSALSALGESGKNVSPIAMAAGTPRREPVSVYVATLPDGLDPDEAIAADPEGWRRAVAGAKPLMDHYFDLIESGLDRSQPTWHQEAIDTLIPAIGQLSGVGLQQHYLERLAALTNVDIRYLRDLTPGASRAPLARRRAPTITTTPDGEGKKGAPMRPDPVRITEEYVAGLLLLHRPLAPDLAAMIAGYSVLTAELSGLYKTLAQSHDPSPYDEELAERLEATVAAKPPIPAEDLMAEVRVALMRMEAERQRRELMSVSAVLAETDGETARSLDGKTLETMARKERLTVLFAREQERRRQLSSRAVEG